MPFSCILPPFTVPSHPLRLAGSTFSSLDPLLFVATCCFILLLDVLILALADSTVPSSSSCVPSGLSVNDFVATNPFDSDLYLLPRSVSGFTLHTNWVVSSGMSKSVGQLNCVPITSSSING